MSFRAIRIAIALAALPLAGCEGLLGITPIVPADAAPPLCGPVGYTAMDLGRIESARPPLFVLDINGDTRPDVVWVTPPNGMPVSTSMLLNTTAATAAMPTFMLAANLLQPLGDVSRDAFVDINGDAKPDYVRRGNPASIYFNTTTAVATGAAMPAFTLPATNPTVDLGGFGLVTSADIDADGRPDLVGWTGAVAHVVLNRTVRNAAAPTFVTKVDVTGAPGGYTIQTVQAGDVNGDGKPDLVMLSDNAGSTSRVLTIAVNTSSASAASFDGMVTIPTPALFPLAPVAIGDLDGDGLADLVIGVRGADGIPGIEILRSTSPRVGAPKFVEVPFDGSDVPSVVRDLDGDRKLDLVFASTFVFIRTNTTPKVGTPTFQPAPGVEFDTVAYDVMASGDLNHDSKLDLVAISTNADRRSSQLAMLLSGPSQCASQ